MALRHTKTKKDRMAFFFNTKDYPDMRSMMEELKELTGCKRAIQIVHTAVRHYLRALKARDAALNKALRDVSL